MFKTRIKKNPNKYLIYSVISISLGLIILFLLPRFYPINSNDTFHRGKAEIIFEYLGLPKNEDGIYSIIYYQDLKKTPNVEDICKNEIFLDFYSEESVSRKYDSGSNQCLFKDEYDQILVIEDFNLHNQFGEYYNNLIFEYRINIVDPYGNDKALKKYESLK